MIDRLFTWIHNIFDPLHHLWESDRTQRGVAGALMGVFLLTLTAIELKRRGLLPQSIDLLPSDSHFYAVNVAFTLVLALEVISLVFTLPCSISKAVGKQFEILALILLRGSFKNLIDLPEPIELSGHLEPVLHIAAGGAGALAIFALLGVYRRMQRPDDEMRRGAHLLRFVGAKKLVALGLLGVLGWMAVDVSVKTYLDLPHLPFFDGFYTVLIFADILLVLIAQRYQPRFRSVFRNSGFVLATLLIRMALTAPAYWDSVIGIGAAVYAMLLALVYNKFYTRNPDSD